MNILMVTSETVPFSKSGGLADVVGALSPALVKSGAEVRVFMPMYSFIDSKGFRKSSAFTVPMLSHEEEVSTLSKHVDGVEYVGLVHPYFTERKGIYGDTSFTPYADNYPRFALFAKAAVLYLKATGWKADIIHCHDWTAGLVPHYADKERIKAKTIFTIHNLAYQGDFSRYDAVLAGDRLDSDFLSGESASERVNMLKGALLTADRITTVSPTYAKEIQTERFGCAMDGILRSRSGDLQGILNGMDYHEWNPMHDKAFSEHFSKSNLSGKAMLKKRIQTEHGFDADDSIPLFAMISRIADQKGYAELLGGNSPLLEEILHERIQMIIIGTGDRHYEEKLLDLDSRYPNLSVKIAFSNKAAHETEGAADFFLMPSRYEPCGLNQMYSLHYGTLPVAHRTGGLADTIIDVDEDPENGNGILINELSTACILERIKRAVGLYSDAKALAKARKNAMTADLSWTRSAQEYLKLYRELG